MSSYTSPYPSVFFFFNDTATTEIYTLSLHDALPIWGIPRGYRHMHGFGSHTYSFINASNERHWVKFHWVCQQGIENFTDSEAASVVASDRESSQREIGRAHV